MTKNWRTNNKEKAAKLKEKFYANNAGYGAQASDKWRRRNPGLNAVKVKESVLRRQEEKAGRKKPKRCEVCHKIANRICFEHCHKTGKFRGWLCHNCNTVLGHAKDSAKLLRKLADYVECHKGGDNAANNR